MPNKKVSFKSDALREEFAASKPAKTKKYYYMLYVAIAIVICAVIGYIIYVNQTALSVDWYGYGKAVASIKTDYDDYDKVIVEIGDDVEVTKEEYYKLKILNDYTFDGLTIEYERYLEKYGADMTNEEKENLRPVRVDDEDIIESIIDIEVGYLEALKSGVYMDYATAYSQINANYISYKNLMDIYNPEDDIYLRAEENIRQMELVASGMGITIDEYIEYLARDSMKALAVAMLEETWQTEFKTTDFDGTIDDYIEYKYALARENYTIIAYDPEK